VLPEDLPSAIEKLQTSARAQQKAQEVLVERLAVHEAERLASAGEKIGAATLVAAAVSGWDANGLKRLASAIASRPASIAVLLGADSTLPVVVTRSQDVSVDAGAILKALIERFGGKGGGKGAMAQGGGLAGDPRLIIEAARDVVKSALGNS
jgi:alanyl-tRNA synthetase